MRHPRDGAQRHEHTVRRYYARNTWVFRRHARAAPGLPQPVHRLPETDRRLYAMSRGYVSFLDLGCGEGATLAYLARCSPDLQLAGLTLSPTQAGIARAYFAATGRAIPIAIGTYLDPGQYPSLPGPRMLTAVESMVHAADGRAFLGATAAYARAGDSLVVVDDFVAPGRGGPEDARGRRLVRAVMAGWKAPSLCGAAGFVRRAAAAGWVLVREEDWSAEVSRGSRCERAGAGVLARLAGLPMGEVASGLAGGSALLVGYGEGVFRYQCLGFRKAGSA